MSALRLVRFMLGCCTLRFSDWKVKGSNVQEKCKRKDMQEHLLLYKFI